MERSNLDVAFELVSKKKNPVEFLKLWEEVSSIQGLSKEEAMQKVGKFYTQLSLDGRFVTLGENTWSLRERHSFDKAHIDMNSVYADDNEDYKDVKVDATEKDLFGDEDEDIDSNNEDDEDEDSSLEDGYNY